MTDHDVLAAALEYARRGWRVAPIPLGLRYPGLDKWQEKATTDETTIRSWWPAGSTSGVCVATGERSGVWVLDIDVKDGHRGEEELAALEDQHDQLPDTYTVHTPSGGRHLYFRYPTDGRQIYNDQSGKYGDGLDIRGEGGQVLAPPTIQHAGGQPYVRDIEEHELAHAPAWLLALVAVQPNARAASPVPSSTTGPRWETVRPNGELPGDAWSEAHTWDRLLTADGWTLGHTDRSGEQHWTRPGKDPRAGTSATVGYGTHDVLKVFTTSHPLLRAESTYTRFGYYAATRHGGDHAAASAQLRAEGWGARPDAQRANPAIGVQVRSDLLTLEPDVWPAPRPLPQAPKPEPWPEGTFPSWIADHVANVAESVQCAPDMPAMFALGALSTIALGRAQVVVRPGHEEWLSVYLLVSLPPSEAKSPALTAMFAPVYEFEDRMVAQQAAERGHALAVRDQTDKAAAAQLAGAFPKDGGAPNPDALRAAADTKAKALAMEIPPDGRLTTSDVTPERLATLLADNFERIALVSDEAGVLTLDRYGDKRAGRNIDIYLQAWSGRPVTVDRQQAPSVRLKRPLLTVCVASQPDAWAKTLEDQELRNRGLTARFMACSPIAKAGGRSMDLSRDAWRVEAASVYTNAMAALAAQLWGLGAQHPVTLALSVGAQREWSRWAQQLEARIGLGGDLEAEAGWVGKLRDSVIRVAALLQIADLDGSREVSADAMVRAIRVGDYWIAHRIMDTVDAVEIRDASRLLATLGRLCAAAEDGTVTRRDVGRSGPRRLRTAADTLPALRILEAHGWVRLVVSDSIADLPIEARWPACEGIRVHPTYTPEAVSAGQADAARQRATARDTDDAKCLPVSGSHAGSTPVAPVAPVAYIGVLEPQSPSFFTSSPKPRATSATSATAEAKGSIFDRPAPPPGAPGQPDDQPDAGTSIFDRLGKDTTQ